ncbi:MAG TPA: porin [Rhizomicrobium sp.]|jgi:phosphate-selective porin OprO/OprP|nr:porin [Rhizomicrobium sp.]
MHNRLSLLAALLLSGASTLAAAHAAASSSPSPPSAATDARLRSLEDELQDVNAQLADLKRSQSSQYDDVRKDLSGRPFFKFDNGRPTFSSADGDFTLAIRTLVQADWGYYSQSAHAATLPAAFGPDLGSGTNFRRVYLGIQGKVFGDWSYNVNFDFGGSGGTETPGHIQSVYAQYDGLAPFAVRVGAYPPPASIEDGTSAGDTIFLERNSPSDLQRNIAGGDGRDSVSLLYLGDALFGAVSYTGNKIGDGAKSLAAAGATASPNFDEQQAVVGRVSDRFWHDDHSNFVVGVNGTYVIKPPDAVAHGQPTLATTPGAAALNSITLSDPPELTVDSNGITFATTGSLPANHVTQWGAEAAGNWSSLYAQAGYYAFAVDRAPAALTVFTAAATSHAQVLQPSNDNFSGYYGQVSWFLTGEEKPYSVANGAFTAPKVIHPFGFGPDAGWGAFELAGRYSDLDLNSHALDATNAITGWTGGTQTHTFYNTARGGDQRILTGAINWYPNNFFKLALQYQYVQVSRLQNPATVNTAVGGTPALPTVNGGQNLSTIAIRAQFAL